MAGVVALSQLTIGMVEETVYRGLVLYTFVRLWANTRWGLVASVLLSALFFGASHMVWVAFGKPVLQSTLLSLSAFESGVFYGAIVLASGSIWPAVILHGLVNAAVNVNLIGFPNYQETGKPGIRMVLLELPVVLFAIYLLYQIPSSPVIPDIP